MTKILALFPTPILTKNLYPGASPVIKDLRKEAFLIERSDVNGREWSEDNYHRGYTSYGSIDQLFRFSSSFDELRKKIDPVVHSYLKTLRLQVPKKEIQMTRMWLNIMGQGCSHPMHLHPLSVLSGTFYLQTPAKAAAIRFEDPRLNSFMARPLAKPLQSAQSSGFHYAHQPKAGEVVLFESWLRHEVPPHSAKTERISVSFNYDWINP